MLTRIKLKNYRCYDEAEQDIALGPLTVLTGRNGAGKSTVLDAIRAMSPSVETDMPFRGFAPHPAEVPDRTDWHKLDATREAVIELFASAPESNLGEADYPNHVPGLEEISRHPIGWCVGVGGVPRRLAHTLLCGQANRGWHAAVTWTGARTLDLPPPPTTLFLDGQEWPVHSHHSHLAYPSAQAFDVDITPTKPFSNELCPTFTTAQGRLKLAQRLATTALAAFGKIRFLSSTRGHLPPDAVMADPPKGVGTNGETLLQFLASIDRSERETEWNWMTQWLKPFGVSSFVARAIGVNKVSASFRDARTTTVLPSPRASSGLRQILPVIVELAFAPPGTCVLVEEPELSVHPLAQQDLAGMLVEAVAANKQVVVTTHSPYLLEALGAMVREKKLDRGSLAACEIARTEAGASRVTEFDLAGMKPGSDWPKSWREAEQHVVDRYTRESGA